MNTKPSRAFVTGVYGQDGSYLAEYLLERGYEVLGLRHESDVSSPNTLHLEGKAGFSVCVGDVCVTDSFEEALRLFSPDEIYNIAAVSDLKTAKEKPEYTRQVNFVAFQNLVALGTQVNPRVRIFQALSSRTLSPDSSGVITESSPLEVPKNAYDESKRDAYERVVLPYREKGFFIASGFLCNHESPRRGDRFVTGKIAKSVARVARGHEEILTVGNIEARRDWSFARDVVAGMHAILSVATPSDYVIGSDELHSVREFIGEAFRVVGKSITWRGEGVHAQGFDEEGILRVAVEETYYQPDDNSVVSNTAKLRHDTGWKREVSFRELVAMMVHAELASSTV